LSSPALIPSRSLTSLILVGDSKGWSFTGNVLHFPLLEALGLAIHGPKLFLEAIVAPKLGCVRLRTGRNSGLELDSVEGKFNDVHYLSLNFCHQHRIAVDSLFRAFPGVRQAELDVFNIFFENPLLYKEVREWRPPMDQWPNLETVILRCHDDGWLHDDDVNRNIVVKWLRRRQELGQPRLRVRLTNVYGSYSKCAICCEDTVI